jgi:predicted PurR-regulated permease PerM
VEQMLDVIELLPSFVEELPVLLAGVQDWLSSFGIHVEILNQFQLESLEELAASVNAWATENSVQIIQSFFSIMFLSGLVIVLSFYFVLDGGRRFNQAVEVLPPAAEREVRFIVRTVDETFYGYVRGMMIISLIYGVTVSTVMMATGLPAALPTGIITALLMVVPFVGDWLAIILPVLIALLAGGVPTFLIVLVVLLVVQNVFISLLTPRILGKAVRMPAMIVVVAVVLGARLAGPAGALLGVPVSAVIYSLAVHYGLRIRRAREAQEDAALAAAEYAATQPAATVGASRDKQGPPQPGRVPAAGSQDGGKSTHGDFQDQLREALADPDETTSSPAPSAPQRRWPST